MKLDKYFPLFPPSIRSLWILFCWRKHLWEGLKWCWRSGRFFLAETDLAPCFASLGFLFISFFSCLWVFHCCSSYTRNFNTACTRHYLSLFNDHLGVSSNVWHYGNFTFQNGSKLIKSAELQQLAVWNWSEIHPLCNVIDAHKRIVRIGVFLYMVWKSISPGDNSSPPVIIRENHKIWAMWLKCRIARKCILRSMH